ncbi:hypothetical protein ACFE04_019745 [Oxalis oulophora]
MTITPPPLPTERQDIPPPPPRSFPPGLPAHGENDNQNHTTEASASAANGATSKIRHQSRAVGNAEQHPLRSPRVPGECARNKRTTTPSCENRPRDCYKRYPHGYFRRNPGRRDCPGSHEDGPGETVIGILLFCQRSSPWVRQFSWVELFIKSWVKAVSPASVERDLVGKGKKLSSGKALSLERYEEFHQQEQEIWKRSSSLYWTIYIKPYYSRIKEKRRDFTTPFALLRPAFFLFLESIFSSLIKSVSSRPFNSKSERASQVRKPVNPVIS